MLEKTTVLNGWRMLVPGLRLGVAAGLLALLAACGRTPVNSPYGQCAERQKTLYRAFMQRSPK